MIRANTKDQLINFCLDIPKQNSIRKKNFVFPQYTYLLDIDNFFLDYLYDYYLHNNLHHNILMIYQYIVYFDIEIDLNLNIFHQMINHIK
jgi:hypothetical protein